MKKKKLFAVFFLIILSLTGCGTTDTKNTPANTDTAMETLKILSEKQTSRTKTNMTALAKKYPEWFDAEGNIIYPVSITSDEYQAATTLEEQYSFFQLPDEIVNSLTTAQLLRTVEALPYFQTMCCTYDNYPDGLEYMTKHFNSFKTLLSRADAGKTAAETYLERDIKRLAQKAKEQSDAMQLDCEIVLEEFLIAGKTSYESMDSVKRQEIIDAIDKNYETEKQIKAAAGSIEYYFYDVAAYGDNPWQKEIRTAHLLTPAPFD